jgi:hypothetical protein
MAENIIRFRFRTGHGSLDVRVGNYELFKTKNSEQTITPHIRLLPGTEITMAIIVNRQATSSNRCPMPRCQSSRIKALPSGGFLC